MMTNKEQVRREHRSLDSPFNSMTRDEFYNAVYRELSKILDVSERELREMSISEIEDLIDDESLEVKNNKDRLGGLLASDGDPYEYMTKDDFERREEEVVQYLNQF